MQHACNSINTLFLECFNVERKIERLKITQPTTNSTQKNCRESYNILNIIAIQNARANVTVFGFTQYLTSIAHSKQNYRFPRKESHFFIFFL